MGGGAAARMEIKCMMRALNIVRMWCVDELERTPNLVVISFTSYMVLIHAHLPQLSLVTNSNWMNPSGVLCRASNYRLFNCKPITWPHTAIYKPITPSKHPVFSDHHYSPAAQSFPFTKYLLPADFSHLIGELFLFKTHASMHRLLPCLATWCWAGKKSVFEEKVE